MTTYNGTNMGLEQNADGTWVFTNPAQTFIDPATFSTPDPAFQYAPTDDTTTEEDITCEEGVDCSIEAAGKKDTMEKAFQSVRNGGGKCIIAGNLPNEEKISLNPMNLIKGKNIVGTWGGEANPDKNIPKYVQWHQSGKMKLDKMITHEYKLKDINRVFDDLENGKVGRAIINTFD